MKAGTTLVLENIIIDGGAVWTGEINEVLQRGTVNSGITATGALVAQIKGASAKPVMFADTVLFNRVSYSVNSENGSLSKISEIPENLYIEDCSDWDDEYFYNDFVCVSIWFVLFAWFSNCVII